MTHGKSWAKRIAAAAIVLSLLSACAQLPRDPEGTLERVRGGALRVGAVAAPPWMVRAGEEATGPEAELVASFARSLGADIEWRWAPLDAQMESLERFELDLVAAGLTAKTPWRPRVALSRPWLRSGGTRRVLAVPPGENALLTAVDRFVETAPQAAADTAR